MKTLNLTNLIQKKYVGTDELRKNLTAILDKLPEEGGEIIITQHGKPQAILFDIESYLEREEVLADSDPELIKELNETIDDVKAGNGIPAQKVFEELGL